MVYNGFVKMGLGEIRNWDKAFILAFRALRQA